MMGTLLAEDVCKSNRYATATALESCAQDLFSKYVGGEWQTTARPISGVWIMSPPAVMTSPVWSQWSHILHWNTGCLYQFNLLFLKLSHALQMSSKCASTHRNLSGTWVLEDSWWASGPLSSQLLNTHPLHWAEVFGFSIYRGELQWLAHHCIWLGALGIAVPQLSVWINTSWRTVFSRAAAHRHHGSCRRPVMYI